MKPHMTAPSLSEIFQTTVSAFSQSFWDLITIQGVVFFATLFAQAVLFPASAGDHVPTLRMLLWLASVSIGYTLQLAHLMLDQIQKQSGTPADGTLPANKRDATPAHETDRQPKFLQHVLHLRPGVLTLALGSAIIWAASLAASVFFVLPGALVWARLQGCLPALTVSIQRAQEDSQAVKTTPLWVPVTFGAIISEQWKCSLGVWKRLSLLAAAPWLVSVVFLWRLWHSGSAGPQFLEDLIIASMLTATTAWLATLSSVIFKSNSQSQP